MLKIKQINFLVHIMNDDNQRQSFYYILLRAGSVISNYILSLFIISNFSKGVYGVFVYGLSIFMFLSTLLKFGVDVHFVKLFSELRDKVIPLWVRRIEYKVILLASLISVIIFSFVQYYDFKVSQNSALLFFIASAPINVAVLLNSGKLRGVSQISKFAFLNITGRVFFTLLFCFVFLLLFEATLPLLIYASHLLSIVLMYLLSYYWTKKRFTYSTSKPLKLPKNFLSYNKSLMIKSYITILFLWGDRFFLSQICKPEEVAEYDITLKIGMIMMIILEALKSTYASTFARYFSDVKNLSLHVRRSTLIGFFTSAVIFIFIVVFGKTLLALFGQEFVSAYSVLVVIAVGYISAAFFGQADNVIEMCNLAKHYVNPYFYVVIFSLSLGVFLTYLYGILGMAIGFSLGNILFQLVASILVRKHIGINTRVV